MQTSNARELGASGHATEAGDLVSDQYMDMTKPKRGRSRINEAFWEGETIDEPPERRGMVSDWMADEVVYFEGRPLANRDIAKAIYRDYDTLPTRHIEPRVRGTMLKGNAESRINAKGYELKSEVIDKAVYYMAVLPGDDRAFDLSRRPSTQELKEFAILIRQREFELQRKLAEEAEDRTRKRKERRERYYKDLSEKVQQVAFDKDTGQLTEFGRQVISATTRGLSLEQTAEEINVHRKEVGLPLRNDHQIAIARAEVKKALGLPGMPEVIEYFYPEKVQELSGPENVKGTRILTRQSEHSKRKRAVASFSATTKKPGNVKPTTTKGAPVTKLLASATIEDILPSSAKKGGWVKKIDYEIMEAAAEQEGEELEIRLRAGIVAMDKVLPLQPAQKRVLEALASGISVEQVASTINVPEDKIVNLVTEGYKHMIELKRAQAEANAA